jgi:hypothetical protein
LSSGVVTHHLPSPQAAIDSEEIALWISKVILPTDDINAREGFGGGTPINDSDAYAVFGG